MRTKMLYLRANLNPSAQNQKNTDASPKVAGFSTEEGLVMSVDVRGNDAQALGPCAMTLPPIPPLENGDHLPKMNSSGAITRCRKCEHFSKESSHLSITVVK